MTAAPEGRHDPARIFPPQPDSCELTLRCRRADYSASRIAKAVEDCDTHLLNLNVTSADISPEAADSLIVDLRINARNAGSVVRSLERYGYEVVDIADAGAGLLGTDTYRDRLEQLLLQIEM